MATIANRYYNSPWIEAAGRNLASALAPPDPDVLREREQKKFQFEYLQKKAGNEEVDRTRKLKGDEVVGKMYRLRSNPIRLANGKIDSAAMDREAYRLADEAAAFGVDRKDIDQGLFEASPGARRKAIAQSIAIQATAQQIALRNSGMMGQIAARGDIASGLQTQEDDAAMQRLLVSGAQKLQEWNLRGALAAKHAGRAPLTITQPLINAVAMQIGQHEKLTGHRLSDSERLQYLGESTDLLQETGDPVMAVRRVMEAHGIRGAGTPTQEVPEMDSIINGLMRLIDPDYDPTESKVGQTDTYIKSDPTAVVPGSMGEAAITPPVQGNPFMRPGDAEAEMEGFSHDAAAAQTRAIPLPANRPKPATGKRQPNSETPAQRKERLRRILLEGKK